MRRSNVQPHKSNDQRSREIMTHFHSDTTTVRKKKDSATTQTRSWDVVPRLRTTGDRGIKAAAKGETIA